MYKLMLIDDEMERLESIKESVDWTKYGVTICGEAHNGKMGIDMIETLKPDIAIIDIRMPLMDGLELINNVRKKNIPIKFIILSGYDDFYYAQKAIELKAVSYLLKPCSIEDMLRAVMRAANIIDTEKKQENLLKSYQEFINKNLPILREKLLVAIIEKQYNDAQVQNDIKKRISNYNLDLPGKYYFVCVLSLDGFDVLSLDYETQGIDYIFFTLTELIRQMLQQAYPLEVFQYKNSIVFILSTEQRDSSPSKLFYYLKNITTSIYDTYNIISTIGISNITSDIFYLWKSYQEARLASQTKYCLDVENIIFYSKLKNIDDNFFDYPSSVEEQIITGIETCDDNIEKYVSDFYKQCYTKCTQTKNFFSKATVILLNNIISFCFDRSIVLEPAWDKIIEVYESIIKFKSLKQIENKILKLINYIISDLVYNKGTNSLVQHTVRYIKSNYMDNIRLDGIAKEVGITPAYLSMLFKQQMGINFVEYVNRYRVERSKELLKNSQLKIYEVAYSIGYQDEKYFFSIFKRYTGLTPAQYRESVLTNSDI